MDTKEKLQKLQERWIKEPQNRKVIEMQTKILKWESKCDEVEKIFIKPEQNKTAPIFPLLIKT